jgi:hypothetical protein
MCLPFWDQVLASLIRLDQPSGAKGVMTTLRLPLVVAERDLPSTSPMIAWSFGLRASNSSATRGRPPVMSCVLVVARDLPDDLALMRLAVRGRRCSRRPEQAGGPRSAEVRQLEGLAGRSLGSRRARAGPRSATRRRTWRQAGDLVELLDHRDALDDVAELHDTGDLGEDRHRERVPFGQELPRLYLVALAHLEHRSVDQAVMLALATRVVDHQDSAVAVHDADGAVFFFARLAPRMRTKPSSRASSELCSILPRAAAPPMWNVRIVSCVPGSPIDSAGDDADGLADVDLVATRDESRP